MSELKLRNKETGEIIGADVREDGIYVWDKLTMHSWKKSLQELAKEYEYYIEPYIKDEKIRKAVKAWAEVNGIKKIIVFDCGNNAPYTPVGAVDFAENGSHLEIRFRTEERFDTDRIYTIGELCGEEK